MESTFTVLKLHDILLLLSWIINIIHEKYDKFNTFVIDVRDGTKGQIFQNQIISVKYIPT